MDGLLLASPFAATCHPLIPPRCHCRANPPTPNQDLDGKAVDPKIASAEAKKVFRANPVAACLSGLAPRLIGVLIKRVPKFGNRAIRGALSIGTLSTEPRSLRRHTSHECTASTGQSRGRPSVACRQPQCLHQNAKAASGSGRTLLGPCAATQTSEPLRHSTFTSTCHAALLPAGILLGYATLTGDTGEPGFAAATAASILSAPFINPVRSSHPPFLRATPSCAAVPARQTLPLPATGRASRAWRHPGRQHYRGANAIGGGTNAPPS